MVVREILRALPQRFASGTARHDSTAVVVNAGVVTIGHGQSAGQSHQHLNGSRRGDPAAHRRANASLEIEQRVLKERTVAVEEQNYVLPNAEVKAEILLRKSCRRSVSIFMLLLRRSGRNGVEY